MARNNYLNQSHQKCNYSAYPQKGRIGYSVSCEITEYWNQNVTKLLTQKMRSVLFILSKMIVLFYLKGQVHSKNKLLSIKAEKIKQTNQKKFEQNRITNKKVMNFWKSMWLWNNENHDTNCQDGYQFLTSCPHNLSIALYSLIPLISLFIPQNLISPCLCPGYMICIILRAWHFPKTFMNFEELLLFSEYCIS